MIRVLLFVAMSMSFSTALQAQRYGLSFSYFIPKTGPVSFPISPFSIRGLQWNISDHVGVNTGITLYRISGLSILDLPFNSNQPLGGPNFTLLLPLTLILSTSSKKNTVFSIKTGGFAIHSIGQQIHEGNFDRALRDYLQWSVVNSDMTMYTKPSIGALVGFEVLTPIIHPYYLSLEVNYLRGRMSSPIRGSYTGGNPYTAFQTVTESYPKAKLDFTGLEIALGISFISSVSK